MKKNIFTFGLIIGTILCANMLYMVNECYTNENFKGSPAWGFGLMIVAFFLMFWGIKNYRDKQLEGVISFWNAFKTGLLIVLVASTMYVVIWLFYYYLVVPDFLDKYYAHVLKETAQTNAADFTAKTKEMDNFKEMYKNPLFVVLLTYMEVLPLGLIIALICALIAKKKNKV